MIDFCRMSVGYVVLLPCLDGANPQPISLPDQRKEAKRNQQLTFCVSTSPYYFLIFICDLLSEKCMSGSETWILFKQECKNVIVLCEDLELLPHPVDGFADIRRRVVLEHHHRVLLRICQEQYLRHLQTDTRCFTDLIWKCQKKSIKQTRIRILGQLTWVFVWICFQGNLLYYDIPDMVRLTKLCMLQNTFWQPRSQWTSWWDGAKHISSDICYGHLLCNYCKYFHLFWYNTTSTCFILETPFQLSNVQLI